MVCLSSLISYSTCLLRDYPCRHYRTGSRHRHQRETTVCTCYHGGLQCLVYNSFDITLRYSHTIHRNRKQNSCHRHDNLWCHAHGEKYICGTHRSRPRYPGSGKRHGKHRVSDAFQDQASARSRSHPCRYKEHGRHDHSCHRHCKLCRSRRPW